jgi:hypothetical protein
MKISFLLFALAALILVGCRKEETINEPEPTACFEMDLPAATPGMQINFYTQCSTETDFFEWDFGDGTSGTEPNPSKIYTQEGVYTVTLTAYSRSKVRKQSTTRTVKVGKMYVRGITVYSLPQNKSNGQPWDDAGNGPDVFATMSLSGQSPMYTSTIHDNVTAADFPLTWNDLNWEIQGDTRWKFELRDQDDASASEQILYAFFNPNSFYYINAGKISLSGPEETLDIFIEIK